MDAKNVGYSFSMEHCFHDLPNLANGAVLTGPSQTHGGLKWTLSLQKAKTGPLFESLLIVDAPPGYKRKQWDFIAKMMVIMPNGQPRDFKIERLQGRSGNNRKDYFHIQTFSIGDINSCYMKIANEQGKLVIRVTVKVRSLTTLRESEHALNFEDDIFDAVFIVQNRRFNVCKAIMALSSSEVLLKMFSEEDPANEVPEFTMDQFTVKQFHFFLEVVYGENVLNVSNVDMILEVANHFAAKKVIKKCEEFIHNCPDLTENQRFRKALIGNLHQLAYEIMARQTDGRQLRAIRPPDELDIVPPEIQRAMNHRFGYDRRFAH